MSPGQTLKNLEEQLEALGLLREDLREQFVTASGPGGQHVNRSSTAVRLRHEPTGVEVRVEGERSQLQNRRVARMRLIDLVEKKRAAEKAEKIARREKQKRARRRPSKAARKRNVETKRKRGAVKQTRKKVSGDE